MSKIRWISLGLAALVVIWMIHFATHFATNDVGGIKGHTVPATEGPSALVRSLRPTYPYSVIPGGAYTPGELQFAHGKDDVVRAHYADFNVKQAKLVTLTDDRFQYASYRIKDQIYWTKKKLRIPKGELLLTDGGSYARARCGNRLSDLPHPAAVSSHEPDEAVLSLPPVDQEMLPKMALADPPALGGVPAAGSLPSIRSLPAEFAQSPGIGQTAQSTAPIVTGFAPAVPMTSGAPGVPGVPGSPGAPVLSTSGPTGTPVTVPPGTAPPVTLPPGTQVSAIQPPGNVTPVPEPGSIYLFLLTFVISVWALMRMTPKDKSER